jgi:hypothetical protein
MYYIDTCLLIFKLHLTGQIKCQFLWQTEKSFDPILYGSKPEILIKTINRRNHIELLMGEVKPPFTSTKLVNEDLVSLGKCMKAAIDKSIRDGAENIVVCGLHIAGEFIKCGQFLYVT